MEPLTKVLQNRAENEYVRGTAAWALGRIGTDDEAAVTLLIETLGSGHVSVRRNSTRALGSLGAAAIPSVGHDYVPPNGRAIPGLVAALEDADATVRVNAAEALWKIDRHPKAVPTLADMVHRPKDPGSYQAVVALGGLGPQTDAAVSALVTAFRHADPDVRRAAARALGEIGPAAIPELKQVLAGPDQEVRRRAVEALGWIGSEAVPALIESLKDESPPVRRAAARALGRLGAQAKAAEPALIEAVNDPNPQVQQSAARALSKVRKE